MAISKLTVQQIVAYFEQMLGWPYESPGSNDENGIDCSGAFVWAYRQAGLSIYHGSNRIERVYCNDCIDLNGSANRLKPGMAVFKYREPGEPYYALGEQYQEGGKYYNGDLRDYYHIGLVESVNPLKIIHATPPVVKRDSKLGKWRRAGFLDAVSGYIKNNESSTGGGNSMAVLYDAKVNTDNGGSLNFRSAPRTGGTRIAEIPNGTLVQVLEETNDEWSKIYYSGREGYVVSRYLKKIDRNDGNGDVETPESGSYCVCFYFDTEEEATSFKNVCAKGRVEAG